MRVVQIPSLSDNYAYLIICSGKGEAAVVDAPEVAPVLAALKKEGVRLTAILNTHHHFDHVGANAELRRVRAAGGAGGGEENAAGGAIEVYGSAADRGRIPEQTRELKEGDRVRVGRIEGRVLDTPGHTRGHIAYLFGDALFCGDTIFVAGCGRLFEGSPEQMCRSLDKLSELPGETKVYCAHEYTEQNLAFAISLEPDNPRLRDKMARVKEQRSRGQSTVPSTIGEERVINPFLRYRTPELKQAVQRRGERDASAGSLDDPVNVFAAIRRMKDSFRG